MASPKFPLTFSTTAIDTDPTADHWKQFDGDVLPHRPALQVAIPPEFDGPGDGFSPEDFLGMAMANCFIATFRVYAGLSGLSYKKLEVSASYDIAPGENKLPIVTKAHLNIVLTGADREDRAERLLKKVSRSCIVLNSLSVEKTFEFAVK